MFFSLIYMIYNVTPLPTLCVQVNTHQSKSALVLNIITQTHTSVVFPYQPVYLEQVRHISMLSVREHLHIYFLTPPNKNLKGCCPW